MVQFGAGRFNHRRRSRCAFAITPAPGFDLLFVRTGDKSCPSGLPETVAAAGAKAFFEAGQFVWKSAEGVLQPNINFEHSSVVLRLCGIDGSLRTQVTIIFPRRINRKIHFEPLTCAQQLPLRLSHDCPSRFGAENAAPNKFWQAQSILILKVF